jgi:hypothetical protein
MQYYKNGCKWKEKHDIWDLCLRNEAVIVDGGREYIDYHAGDLVLLTSGYKGRGIGRILDGERIHIKKLPIPGDYEKMKSFPESRSHIENTYFYRAKIVEFDRKQIPFKYEWAYSIIKKEEYITTINDFAKRKGL